MAIILNKNTLRKLEKVRTVVIVFFVIISVFWGLIMFYNLESGRSNTVLEGKSNIFHQPWLDIPEELEIAGPILTYGFWIALAMLMVLVRLTVPKVKEHS